MLLWLLLGSSQLLTLYVLGTAFVDPQTFRSWIFVILWETDHPVSSFPFSASFWSPVGSLGPRSLYRLQQDQGSEWS